MTDVNKSPKSNCNDSSKEGSEALGTVSSSVEKSVAGHLLEGIDNFKQNAILCLQFLNATQQCTV